MKSFLLVAALIATSASTAQAGETDAAWYAPSYAGYVVGPDSEPRLLRDPLSLDKIRCREDLVRLGPTLAAAVARDAHDDAWKTRSAIMAGPFTALAEGGQALAIGLMMPALGVYSLAAPSDQRTLYGRARRAFIAGRSAEARSLFLAVVSDASGIEPLPRAWVERSFYYLALSDEALRRDDEARDAFRAFLYRGSSPDLVRYADAALRLERLEGKPAEPCSRADFTLGGDR